VSEDVRALRRPPPPKLRVVVPVVAGLLAFAVGSLFMPWELAALLGWNAAAGVFVGWVWLNIRRLDSDRTSSNAVREDDFEAAAHVFPILAGLVSLVGAGFALLRASQESGVTAAAITGLATLTVVLSWLGLNTAFTLRYAQLYYGEAGGRGIDFHGDPTPDYRDFAYLAFTIGMTYQVSDTDLGHKAIRRTVLRHSLLSYVYGTAVVAVMVNVVAGLLSP
jgi:uncharacterized membrane protein